MERRSGKEEEEENFHIVFTDLEKNSRSGTNFLEEKRKEKVLDADDGDS